MSLKTPDGSSAVRARPNMNSSTSGSHARKRGQARVQEVQPFWPWLQLSGREAVLQLERPVDALGRRLYPSTSCGHAITQPAHPVHNPDVTTSE